MRLILASTMAVMLCTSLIATPAITNVTAQQRYPWNGKVDITYTVLGIDDLETVKKEYGLLALNLKVSAIDCDSGVTNVATALSGDTALTNGTHCIVWDMDVDGLTFKSTNVIFSVSCETTPATYCVIDLSAGKNASSYPVTYLATPPSGSFNTDVYKTTKLVLKRIEAGSFKMGGSTQTTLTKPFFIGLFEVTQKQYLLVTGNNSSNFSGDKRPVEMVSFNAIHGSWGSEISSASFIGKIRTRTGLDFNLPTEVQWEYACRAGTTTTYSYGDSANGNYMWYEDNSSSQTHDVGTRQPNPWGLYDMHGNVYEWCQDYSAEGTTRRVVRGGTWRSSASYCTSSTRSGCYPDLEESYIGFRLARVLNK
jgi:hypothetical protein